MQLVLVAIVQCLPFVQFPQILDVFLKTAMFVSHANFETVYFPSWRKARFDNHIDAKFLHGFGEHLAGGTTCKLTGPALNGSGSSSGELGLDAVDVSMGQHRPIPMLGSQVDPSGQF